MKRIITILLLAVITLGAFAQSKDNAVEKVRARRVSYITEQVQLTPSEAERFWPLYNELSAKLDELRAVRHKAEQSLSENASEADYAKANQVIIDSRKQMSALREDYYKKFQTVLSQEKIHRLYVAERNFRKVVLNDMKKK